MGKDHYQRRVRGHRRDRPGRRGDDVLDRRGVRADRVHGRHRRAVVRAVRADDRLLGAGVAVRVVLARPDAVGVLARSAHADGAAAVALAAARPVQPLVRPPGRALQERDRAGRSTTAWSMVALAIAAFVGALALPALGLLGGGFCPVTDDSEFIDARSRRRPARTSRTRGSRREEVARIARTQPEVALHLHRPSADRAKPSTQAPSSSKLTPKAERSRSQQTSIAEIRRELATLGGRHGVDHAPASTTARSRSSCSCRVPTSASCSGWPTRSLARGAAGARRGRRRALDQGAEAGARRAARSRPRRLARRHGRPGRAGAAAGVRRHRRRRLDRSVGRDARRHVRLAPESRTIVARPRVAAADRRRRRTAGRRAIPLGQVAQITPSIGPARIDHLDRERVITVQANTEGRPLSEVDRRHHGAGCSRRAAAARLHAHARAARPRSSRRSSAASSSRSASRSC